MMLEPSETLHSGTTIFIQKRSKDTVFSRILNKERQIILYFFFFGSTGQPAPLSTGVASMPIFLKAEANLVLEVLSAR